LKGNNLSQLFPSRPESRRGDSPPPGKARTAALVALLAATAVTLLLWTQTVAGEPHPGPAPRLQGTFLQLTEAHGDWQPGDWARLFGYFKELGLSQLVIQWTVYGDLAFFPSSAYRQVPRPPLFTLLQMADAAGLKVWVGLTQDPAFWEKISREPHLVDVYLRRVRLLDEALARELAPQLQGHPCFRGWYLTEEIDDVNWREAPARTALFGFLRDLSTLLHQLTPGTRVAVSGFANGRTDPRTFARFWQALLGAAAIDVVFLQDSVGAGKLQLEELPPYLQAMRQATRAQSRDLQVVVELFRQLSEKPFRAQPASWEQVARQLELDAPYSPGGLLAFSVPEYMSPLGGPKAKQLFQAYLHYLKSTR
jgi:hypothetical protein